MAKVLLTTAHAPIAEGLRRVMPAGVTFEALASSSAEDFARQAADADILIAMQYRIDAAALALAPRVRFIQCPGAGYDHIDLAATRAAGILVAHSPGGNAVPVAEHTILLILATLKLLIPAEQATRAGRWPFREFLDRPGDLAGATVGLVGLGHVARAVAQRLAPFEARLLYSARRRAEREVEERLGLGYRPLDELLAESQIVSLHLALTDETRGCIGERELALMQPRAILINTARGGLIDEAALKRALERGQIAGAGLDVLQHEAEGGNPFAAFPNVIVTPHMASSSRGAGERLFKMTADNVARFLAGEPVRYLVPGQEPDLKR